jgi:mycothiol system anti-sigma-R factor
MSCGDPHDVDCSKVLAAVYLYLDGEMQHQDLQEVRQHLDECSPCLQEYGIEREVKVLVARSCCESAPDGLREAVVARIQAVRAELRLDTGE